MLKLNLTGRPERIELGHGAVLICDPVDYDIVLEVILEAEGAETLVVRGRRLGARVITGWEGLADLGTGEPLEFTPELVPSLLRQPVVWSAFWEQYAMRAFGMVSEGNGSAPSSDGTSEGDAPIAKGAATSSVERAKSAPRGSGRATRKAKPSASSKAKKQPASGA
ncbi:hypothetical protein [Pelagovum pacificum]|uniref:Uncharacterized protein n=1 Tax=Pelagovum pacificum TaxID=2588711 RepID=A0A5C5GFE9_9RHOB|nr:hypothetical protein [Pelagovum pacificum]QQA43957.1 hypothetical protein I8N54_05095 [Pelagovum pacificum]TNY32914.1 hypothetical protein FHY64_06455 [Pelagovum pacificum]